MHPSKAFERQTRLAAKDSDKGRPVVLDPTPARTARVVPTTGAEGATLRVCRGMVHENSASHPCTSPVGGRGAGQGRGDRTPAGGASCRHGVPDAGAPRLPAPQRRTESSRGGLRFPAPYTGQGWPAAVPASSDSPLQTGHHFCARTYRRTLCARYPRVSRLSG
jgi:hypothetical protein